MRTLSEVGSNGAGKWVIVVTVVTSTEALGARFPHHTSKAGANRELQLHQEISEDLQELERGIVKLKLLSTSILDGQPFTKGKESSYVTTYQSVRTSRR